MQVSCDRLHQIVQGPSANYHVESHDNETGEYAQPAHPFPGRTGCQFVKSPCCVGLGRPSHNKLADHQRYTKK